MKLALGIAFLAVGFAWARWQIRRYRSRPAEAIAEDVLDIVFDVLPNVGGILIMISLGSSLIHAHFTGS